MGHNKEVDEWLLGSGESAETAASQTKNMGSGLIPQPSKKQEEPKKAADEEDNWMFRTFSKNKKSSGNNTQEAIVE